MDELHCSANRRSKMKNNKDLPSEWDICSPMVGTIHCLRLIFSNKRLGVFLDFVYLIAIVLHLRFAYVKN